MKKSTLINLISIMTCISLFYLAYSVLLHDNFLHLSISSIISQAHGLEITSHLIVLALLPFYIAVIIFGTATLSVYLATLIRQRIAKFKPKVIQEKIAA